MGEQAPPTLLQLALQKLWMEETLLISNLEDIPVGLFPTMFEDAITDKRTNILRALVPVWPFPCLPAGALIKDLETLKALLDGLDALITEKVHSSFTKRTRKLRVLDLTDVCLDFQSFRALKRSVKICPKSGGKKRFVVVTDIDVKKASFSEWHTYLLQWAQQQNDSVHLCCRKLKSWNSPVFTAERIFKMVDADCIRELQLSLWQLESMPHLFPYLGQMRNLHTLVLKKIQKPFRLAASVKQELISLVLSQFNKLPCLQNLYISYCYFLAGCFEEWPRRLKIPLETLTITGCWFSPSDLGYLSQSLYLCELRHLKLSDVELSHLCLKPLVVLFERITSTLQILELEECGMRDRHFNAIGPALSQCSQLTRVNFYHNYISLHVFKNLLHHTAKLSKLTHEMYPVPLECHDFITNLRDRFRQLCPEVLDILRAKRQPTNVFFATRTDCVRFQP
ncbi:oogenesin-3-like [Microtus oregoni]|uniref:oogenesin-3-like n=1 Tax=Microtus oregoni TaxID=111838 RepID=UPI001BB15B00|nr:oogenesin-3-like [Microtus oregoni]